ncbi:MAG: sel1 repeat family protein [Candidatus Thioglobus sp.]|nr:sel1 repeat family protein [Candidatus Thioglobus sp.]
MVKLKSILLFLLFVTSAYADLDKAVELAEQGKVNEGKLELIKIVKAADAGDAKAQLEFGIMWATEGYWLWQDNERAIKWWLKSAEQGYIPAQLMMGTVYLGGIRTKQDLDKSDEWFDKAISADESLVELIESLKAMNKTDN